MQIINSLTTDLNNTKKEINSLNTCIKEIESENKKLQASIIKIQNQISQLKPNQYRETVRTNQEKENKTIVLYGLQEHQWENEFELHNRIIHIFQDFFDVNLTGYIEEVSRIGKKGYRRPLQIELLNKRLTKYILSNKRILQKVD